MKDDLDPCYVMDVPDGMSAKIPGSHPRFYHRVYVQLRKLAADQHARIDMHYAGLKGSAKVLVQCGDYAGWVGYVSFEAVT